ncbi:acyltransferase family protein [Glaciecola sp. 1036]|uniref:acyltransferase family protein n=1 Tax=Alteromonadaceae TaxID=72275 RepID=UPI003D07D243
MRNLGLDLSRGLLMIYIVVIIHGVFWLGLMPAPFSGFLLLEMPLIFLISGYTFGLTSGTNSRFSYLNFAVSRLTRILVPYFGLAIATILLLLFSSTYEQGVLHTAIKWLNPIKYGAGATESTLNWHLWFIPQFIVVTLCLPLFKYTPLKKLPTFLLLISFLIGFTIFSAVQLKLADPTFYLFWAWLGFVIADKSYPQKQTLLMAAAVFFLILTIGIILFDANIDMQENKFPPNITFLIFSAIWVCLALLLPYFVSNRFIDKLSNQFLVSLFIKHGYSIYLWQGIGYYLAIQLQNQIGLNNYLVWIIAVVLTTLMGVLASPLEQVRIHTQKSTPSQK